MNQNFFIRGIFKYRNFIQSFFNLIFYNTLIKKKGEKEIMNSNLFEAFNNGVLILPEKSAEFADIPWSKHPAFEGVELKALVTAKDTGGQFSYHLVRIAPNKSIQNHIHETQLETHEIIDGSGICINNSTRIPYNAGTLSIIPAGVWHEVCAGENGLYLFAKFIPALC